MTVLLNAKRIRASSPAQLRDYYNELLTEASEEVITTELLDAVFSNLIPPTTFAPWLGVTKSFTVIRRSLLQNQSSLIQHFATKQLRKHLQKSSWKTTWEGVGGTAGILEILAETSVAQVRTICKAIGRCARGIDMNEKRGYITELYKGLHPRTFPDARHKTIDQRSLVNHYGHLLPACESDLIVIALAGDLRGVWKHAKEGALLEHHPEELGQRQLSSLTGENTTAVNQKHIKVLINRYRTTTPSNHGFSASMKFALTCLRALSQSQSCKMDESFVTSDLIRSLLSRAVRKRTAWDKIVEIIDLALKYFENYPLAGKLINSEVGHVLHLVASCWTHRPSLFETQLRTLLDHPEYGTSCLDTLTSWGGFLSGILPSRRYELMRFCILASTKLDIEVDADLSQIKGGLSQSLLISLDHSQALELFDRVRKVRGDYAFLQGNAPDSILDLEISYHVAIRDAEIWHIHLLKLKGDHQRARTCAESYIDIKRKSAKSASKPEQRSHYAKATLFAAIASGSLDCYSDSLKWAQRFLNDPTVLRELYPQSYSQEAARILSGVPEPIDNSLTMPTLRNGVDKANAILVDIFNTACSAMMQPSFSSSDWRGILNLLQQVVGERIKLTEELSKRLEVSNDELYDSVWEGTVHMLITLEERANSKAHEKLELNRLGGLLDFSYTGNEAKAMIPKIPTLRFFDQLAKARDELWRKLRAAARPGINTIPKCLPRGLPIQSLTCSWNLQVEDLGVHNPYLASRVHATLFADPALAFQPIPTDNKSRKLIGVFVDSYKCALRLYIPNTCTKAVRQARVKEVWDYATGVLSRGRIHDVDVVRYWQEAIPEYLSEWPLKDSFAAEPWSKLPELTDSMDCVIWNPLASESTNMLAIEPGKPTYIDLCVTVRQTSAFADITHMLSLEDHAYEELEPDHESLWNSKHGRKLSENQVLSALLYLDASFIDEEDRILQTPYPSIDDYRYPAIRLDEEFISCDELDASDAVQSIRGHLGSIPPDLLYRLARNALRALKIAETKSDSSEADSTHELQKIAMLLIVRLGESDKPSLAIQLAIDTIIDQPVSSSWHRDLIKVKFLQRLSAADAADCYQTLVNRISEIAQEDMNGMDSGDTVAVKSPATPNEEGNTISRKTSHVKVTTIKMLVQLLRGTGFVGGNVAIDTLRSLATIAPHVDVRLSIVNTLVDMLDRFELAHTNDILEILESVTKDAGHLNEREPLAEVDWKKAEASIQPPDIRSTIDEPTSTTSPMLTTLVAHIGKAESDAQYLKPYLRRIIFPIFQKSKQETAKWVSIFLRKHGIDETAQRQLNLPFVPHRTDVILLRALRDDQMDEYDEMYEDDETDETGGMYKNVVKIQSCKEVNIVPTSILKSVVAYAIFAMDPPPPIAALNKRLKSDPALSSQPDTQIYNILYTKPVFATQIFRSYDLFALTARLSFNATKSHLRPHPNDGGITAELAQSQFCHLFTTLIHKDLPTFPALSDCLLYQLLAADYITKPWWHTHGKPLLASLIAYVDLLRTPEWRADPHRSPAVLPDTLPWQLMLLDYPAPCVTDRQADIEAKCQVFASQILDLIAARELEEGGESTNWHKSIHDFEQIESYFNILPDYFDDGEDEMKLEMLRLALARNYALTAAYLWDGESGSRKGREMVLRVARLLIETSYDANGREWMCEMEPYMQERLRGLVEAWKGSEEEEVRRVGYEVELKFLAK